MFFNSSIEMRVIFPLAFSMRSWRLGLIAVPSFVTIASTTSPGVVMVVTCSRTIGFDFRYIGQVIMQSDDPAAVAMGVYIDVEVGIDFSCSKNYGI